MGVFFICLLFTRNTCGGLCNEMSSNDRTLIQVCAIQFKPVGAVARFRGSIVFQIKTSEEKGKEIQFLEVNYKDSFDQLVNIDALKNCLRTWNLQSDMFYTVKLVIGTTLEPTIYIICDRNENCLEFVIPK